MTTVFLLVASALVSQGSRFQDSSSIVRSRPAASAATAIGQRSLAEYQRELTDLFRREALAQDNAARAAAIRGLCSLHRALVSDSRYATNDMLKEYRNRIWSRLTKVKTELKREFAGAADQQALDDAASLESADALAAIASDSLAASLSLSGQSQGGPGYLLSSGAFGGGAGTGDYGPQLVTLIERTINPAFWDVVGGPGTIVYYQPLQCLVVRATSEIHGNLGGLIGGLRKVGP